MPRLSLGRVPGFGTLFALFSLPPPKKVRARAADVEAVLITLTNAQTRFILASVHNAAFLKLPGLWSVKRESPTFDDIGHVLN